MVGIDLPRITVGTVPGTVPGVVRMGVRRWTSSAVLGVVLPAIGVESQNGICRGVVVATLISTCTPARSATDGLSFGANCGVVPAGTRERVCMATWTASRRLFSVVVPPASVYSSSPDSAPLGRGWCFFILAQRWRRARKRSSRCIFSKLCRRSGVRVPSSMAIGTRVPQSRCRRDHGGHRQRSVGEARSSVRGSRVFVVQCRVWQCSSLY
jgi:hypothetical protein